MTCSIILFRLDLRLADNPALSAAVKRRGAVIPAFIWSPEEPGTWAMGGASRWWLHHSLKKLADSLQRLGSRLIILRGPYLATLRKLVGAAGADAVYWNRRYEPDAAKLDHRVEQALLDDGLRVETFNGRLLFEPTETWNQQGRPFQVFTAYWRACLKMAEPDRPVSSASKLPSPGKWPSSLSVDALGLAPRANWAEGIGAAWCPGEQGAKDQLRRFLAKGLAEYATDRDFPDRTGTSRLSPHLHFGEISPRQVWHAVQTQLNRGSGKGTGKAAEAYLRELGWREFAHQLLVHFPHTVTKPLRTKFERFPWKRDSKALRAWQRGQTGYPIVDAGMRELWTTGWMHNRVRMIVASFLVKHLLIDWRDGAAWFWDTLVDADLANNTLGWQWAAGCGADAAPYFRIFNPVLQGRKFDPDGTYVRKWIPELSGLSSKWIHAPWEAPAIALESAEIELDDDYPTPIVDHAAARKDALAALAGIRE